MPVHVELSCPGDDADDLEAVLLAAGFRVARVALAELGRHGAASVVDVAQAEAETAIEELLARGAHPVVRVGGRSAGGLSRPVGHDALLVALRRALSSRGGFVDREPHTTVTQDVGHTFQPGIEVATLAPGLPLAEVEVPGADPSDALAAALESQGGELLMQHLARGHGDGPRELSPDALFDTPFAPQGPDDDHELTALELALPDLEASAGPGTAEAPRGLPLDADVVNPREGWLVLDDPTLGTPDATGGYRTGQTGPLGMVRLLWRIAELSLDLELDASFEHQRLIVRYLAGGVRELKGNAHQRLLRDLEPALEISTEREARALVESELLAGKLSRFEVDRRLRLASEAQLSELALSSQATFTLRSLSARDGHRLAETASPLARPALVLVVREARRTLGIDTLEPLAGGAPTLRLPPSARARLQQAEVEPELRALLNRHHGGPLAQLFEEADPEVGVAGLLCVLAVLDAARFVRDSAKPG